LRGALVSLLNDENDVVRDAAEWAIEELDKFDVKNGVRQHPKIATVSSS
jgi:HEAT repeat protein